MRTAQKWLMIYGNQISTLICSSIVQDSDSDGIEYKSLVASVCFI